MDAVEETESAEVAALMNGSGNNDRGKILQVECGLNKAVLHLERLCQGSKGACILFEKTWMTPNEFQAASGRETAKDWKRSIKHHDKSLKLLIIKGFLFVDPAVCKCEHCFADSLSPPSHAINKETSDKDQREEFSSLKSDTKTNNILTKCTPTKKRKPSSAEQAAPFVRKLRQVKAACLSRNKLLSPTRPTENVSIKHKHASGRNGEKELTVDEIRSTEPVNSDLAENEKDQDKENVIDSDSRSGKSEETLSLAAIKQSFYPNEEFSAVENSDIAISNDDCTCTSRNGNSNIAALQDKQEATSSGATDISEDTTIQATDGNADSLSVDNGIHQTKVHITTVNIGSDDPVINDCTKDKTSDLKYQPDVRHDEQKRSVLSELQFDCKSNDSNSAEKQERVTPDETDVTPNGAVDARIADAKKQEIAEGKSSDDGINGSLLDVCSAAVAPPECRDSTKGVGDAREAVQDAGTGATMSFVNNTTDVTNDGIPRGSLTGLTNESPAWDSCDTLQVSCNFDKDNDLSEKTRNDECREHLSPQREARLQNIIEELKVYKKQLVEKIEGSKRRSAASEETRNKEEASQMSESVKTERPHLMRDSKSAPSPLLSVSPLHRILFQSHLQQASSVDDLSRSTSSGGRCSTSRQLIYPQNDVHRSVWSVPGASETVGATLHYTAGYNGPFSGITQPYSRHSTEQCSRSKKRNENDKCLDQQRCNVDKRDSVNNTMCNVVDNNCLPKTPTRSSTGPITTSFSTCVANMSLLQRSAPKRLLQTSWSESTVPKQRRSRPVNSSGMEVCVLNLSSNNTNRNNDSVVTSSFVTTPSQYEMHRSKPGKERRYPTAETRVVAASHGHKSPRRAPVNAWTADDVHAFVLSIPHGAPYAKEFLELRITGRVLQNLTAIQMMRILRIGEHAARAVRTAVEKLLVTSYGPAHALGTRR